MNKMVADALERFRNSDGFACSDKTEDRVMEDLVTLARAFDSLESCMVDIANIVDDKGYSNMPSGWYYSVVTRVNDVLKRFRKGGDA